MCSGWFFKQFIMFCTGSSPLQILCTAVNKGNLQKQRKRQLFFKQVKQRPPRTSAIIITIMCYLHMKGQLTVSHFQDLQHHHHVLSQHKMLLKSEGLIYCLLLSKSATHHQHERLAYRLSLPWCQADPYLFLTVLNSSIIPPSLFS